MAIRTLHLDLMKRIVIWTQHLDFTIVQALQSRFCHTTSVTKFMIAHWEMMKNCVTYTKQNVHIFVHVCNILFCVKVLLLIQMLPSCSKNIFKFPQEVTLTLSSDF